MQRGEAKRGVETEIKGDRDELDDCRMAGGGPELWRGRRSRKDAEDLRDHSLPQCTTQRGRHSDRDALLATSLSNSASSEWTGQLHRSDSALVRFHGGGSSTDSAVLLVFNKWSTPTVCIENDAS